MYQAQQGLKNPGRVSFRLENIPGDDGQPGFTALAAAYVSDAGLLPKLLETVKPYQVNSFCRSEYEQVNLALFNITKNDLPLCPADLSALDKKLRSL